MSSAQSPEVFGSHFSLDLNEASTQQGRGWWLYIITLNKLHEEILQLPAGNTQNQNSFILIGNVFHNWALWFSEKVQLLGTGIFSEHKCEEIVQIKLSFHKAESPTLLSHLIHS